MWNFIVVKKKESPITNLLRFLRTYPATHWTYTISLFHLTHLYLFLHRDIVFGNESEAEAFATANDFGTKDLKEIAVKIGEMPKVTIAVME